MARYDGGQYADIVVNGDVHTHNQKAAGLASRALAKTFYIDAFLYGSGAENLGKIAGGGRTLGQQLMKKFLAGLPALKRLKAQLEAVVKSRGFHSVP